MSVLNHKLRRDLWQVKGQAIAIALVIAMGVMMLVMMDGLVNSLSDTKDSYYQRYRLADVFAPVKRAPQHLLKRIGALQGVTAVEGRINASALINLPSMAVPVQARAVSVPEFRAPRLNAVHLSAGRQITSSDTDEILLLEGFANAHSLRPGDRFSVTIQGARRELKIVGLAQAPEFLYTTAPGELVPDDKRFAVIWMNQKALEAAYDMQGAFNEVLLTHSPHTPQKAIISELDRLLEEYGALGAYGLNEHVSNRFITEEIAGLTISARTVPPIFLGVSAFLLYIVVARMVQSQRSQIGLLKAFGYTDTDVAWHYLKFVLVIAIAGAVLGGCLGVLAGHNLSGFYQRYYTFPYLLFSVDPVSFMYGFTVSVIAASSASLLVMKKIFKLAPATAMNPPAPPDFSHSLNFGPRLRRWLDQPTRMVLRSALRQPMRLLLSVTGIALGMALSVAMLSVMSAFDKTLELNFSHIDRSDVSVSFIEPLGEDTRYALQRLRGVLLTEPFRVVPVQFTNGRYTYRGSIIALTQNPRLYRALDRNQQPLHLPQHGLILSRSLANELAISAGQFLTAQIREGRRPTLQIPVVGLADTLMGSPAYMQLASLNRLMGEPHRVSGAYLRIDQALSTSIYQQLKDMPVVAGVSLKQDSRAAFAKVMNTGAGAIRFVMMAIAALITFGIIYNSARIAFSERARDLASLRVLGLTRAETAFILLGELALITLLALPLGAVLGHYLSFMIATGFSTDLYRIPVTLSPPSHGIAAIAVLLATLVCAALVVRDINRLDLVSSLKIRE